MQSCASVKGQAVPRAKQVHVDLPGWHAMADQCRQQIEVTASTRQASAAPAGVPS